MPFTLYRYIIQKLLRINLPKKSKDLYTENYKMLMKESKDDTDRWKDIPCSYNKRINTVKITIFPKGIYKYSDIVCDTL